MFMANISIAATPLDSMARWKLRKSSKAVPGPQT